jgi:hypothetical protein
MHVKISENQFNLLELINHCKHLNFHKFWFVVCELHAAGKALQFYFSGLSDPRVPSDDLVADIATLNHLKLIRIDAEKNLSLTVEGARLIKGWCLPESLKELEERIAS